MSPSSTMMTSPGTTSVAGTLSRFPSRTTRACAAVMRWRAATAASARDSWTYPIVALSSTTARIAMASYGSGVSRSKAHMPAEIVAATSRRMTSASPNCARNLRHRGIGLWVASSFRP
jgi:hypothetical protein